MDGEWKKEGGKPNIYRRWSETSVQPEETMRSFIHGNTRPLSCTESVRLLITRACIVRCNAHWLEMPREQILDRIVKATLVTFNQDAEICVLRVLSLDRRCMNEAVRVCLLPG